MAKKLTSTELPNWPRLLPLPLAAAYTGISEAMFRRGVAAGFWPRPLKITAKVRGKGGRTLWDRKLLDARVDELSKIVVTRAAEEAVIRTMQHREPQPPQPPRRKQGHVLR